MLHPLRGGEPVLLGEPFDVTAGPIRQFRDQPHREPGVEEPEHFVMQRLGGELPAIRDPGLVSLALFASHQMMSSPHWANSG